MTPSSSTSTSLDRRPQTLSTWARLGAAGVLALAAATCVCAQTVGQHEAHVHPAAKADLSTAATPKAALPGDSVYHLQVPLTDQTGRSFRIDELAGRPVLVSMFYGSCKFVCPMLIDTMRATSDQVPAAQREHLVLLMVSIDPAHDSVAALKRLGDERKLDPTRWTLARTDAKSVRKLAAVLGIQYRALPDGEFNHSTELILLDGSGHIAGRTARMGTVDTDFVKLVGNQARNSVP